MQINPQAGITTIRDAAGTRRRRGRVPQEAVVCDLGYVVDLSATGMKVRARRVPRGTFTTILRGLGHDEIHVKGHVVWTKRSGLFKKLIGIEFLDVSPDLAKKIANLGLLNRNRRTV